MANGDDERRLRSVGRCQAQIWVVRRYKETDNNNTSNVEKENADVDALNGLG